jgi:hypothetical protein
MQKIPLNLVQPGMVLAKPVARPDGMVVAAPGTELTESMLSRFEAMGIGQVVVEGSPVDMEGGGDTAFDKRIERLDHIFRKHESDKWMNQIKRLVKHFFKMKAAQRAKAEAKAKAEAEEEAKKAEAEGRVKNGEEERG